MAEEDCTVPDHITDPSSTPMDASVAANIHLTALRLSLSPQALSPEVYLGSVPPGTFESHLNSSPVVSPNSLLLFPDTLAYSSGNPFLCGAQPYMPLTGLSSSPQSFPGFSSLHIRSTSPTNSFPPPSFSSPYLHRIPVTLSMGTDYYHQHSASAPPSLYQPASVVLFPSSNGGGADLPRSQDTTPPGNPCVGSRHSSAEELPVSPHLLQLPQQQQQHRRRYSSSSVEQQVARRYSQTTRTGRQNGIEMGRGEQQRRRSHDVRAEQAELLESLRVAAAARRSSAHHYIRVFGPQS